MLEGQQPAPMHPLHRSGVLASTLSRERRAWARRGAVRASLASVAKRDAGDFTEQLAAITCRSRIRRAVAARALPRAASPTSSTNAWVRRRLDCASRRSHAAVSGSTRRRSRPKCCAARGTTAGDVALDQNDGLDLVIGAVPEQPFTRLRGADGRASRGGLPQLGAETQANRRAIGAWSPAGTERHRSTSTAFQTLPRVGGAGVHRTHGPTRHRPPRAPRRRGVQRQS